MVKICLKLNANQVKFVNYQNISETTGQVIKHPESNNCIIHMLLAKYQAKIQFGSDKELSLNHTLKINRSSVILQYCMIQF